LEEKTLFSPIKQKRISEEIAEQLKALIFEGRLQPGESLPPERELAKSLNVSRVSLREALNTLQGMGLIEIQQGNRTFVRPITTRSIYDPLVSFCKESSLNILKVFEIRKYLEVGSIALAAQRASENEIKEIGKLLKGMEEDLKHDRLGAKTDMDFHYVITKATHNEAYIHTMQTIYDLLQEELRLAWGGVFEKQERRQALFEQHRNIFTAIKERSPEKGIQAAIEHMNYVEENWQVTMSGKNRSVSKRGEHGRNKSSNRRPRV